MSDLPHQLRLVELCGNRARTVTAHRAPVQDVATSQADLAASAGADGTLRIRDPRTERPAMMMRVDGDLYDCSWSDDGTLLATASQSAIVRFWRD